MPTYLNHPLHGRVRVLHRHSPTHLMVADHKDVRRLVSDKSFKKPKPDNGQMALFDKALKITGGMRTPRHDWVPMAGGKHGGTRAIPQLHPDDLAEAKRQAAALRNSAGQPRWMVQNEVEDAGRLNAKARGGKEMRFSDKPEKPRKGRLAPSYGLAGMAGAGGMYRAGSRNILKSEPLKTSVSEDDARKLVARHGLKGPLPKTLDRNQRMAAYEARYVSAGGRKAEKWQHRAQTADKVKTAGLGVATVGGAGWLATRGKLKSKLSPAFAHHAETVAGAGAVAGGAGELYAGHARRKRSSYASAPAGVAASALRRMQGYTP